MGIDQSQQCPKWVIRRRKEYSAIAAGTGSWHGEMVIPERPLTRTGLMELLSLVQMENGRLFRQRNCYAKLEA